MIDTIGVLPTADESRAFLADTSPDKRDRLIESLLARPEFVDYWTYKWCDLLLVNSEKLPPPAMWAYYRWIRTQVAQNTPWDKFARSIVTASGSTLENGAANFFALHQDPLELAETTSQAFLGMSINCAHCHNHPLEKWTNDQYYGMANLFARVKVKNADGDGNLTVYSTTEGELIQPRTGQPQPPRPLDGQPVAVRFDGRSPDGAGRLAHRAGESLLQPRDHQSRLGEFLRRRPGRSGRRHAAHQSAEQRRTAHGAGQASGRQPLRSQIADAGHPAKRNLSALQPDTCRKTWPTDDSIRIIFPRRMMAEVLLDAMSQVTGAPTEFKGYAAGWRALQLPDSNVNSYFLKSFGRPLRQLTCECERTAEPSMVQVLHISNGDTINQKLAAKGNRIEQQLSKNTPSEQIVEEAYLGALARLPTPDERRQLVGLLDKPPNTEHRAAVEDLYWSLLTSQEFLFDH